MNQLPLRPITAAEKADYERDGVVNLAGMFDQDWIERLRGAIQRDMDNPSRMATNFNAEGTPGRFFGDMFMWTWDPDFRAAFIESPAPAIAAQMMGAAKCNVFYDQLFAKEPGTAKPTPWHQDQPYWPVKGWQVTTIWLALDHINRDNGAVEFIAGSHKWDRWFRPVAFKEGNHNDLRYQKSAYEKVPDIEATRADYDIKWFDMQAGDCLVFHSMIMHGAPGNSTTRRRRGLAMRFTGDDAVYDPREGTFQMVREPEIPAGAIMDCDLFPRVWPRG
jgi:ectoine hydroxylase-related dioxygenase (phytanoyl-CoA dioxygenase family)